MKVITVASLKGGVGKTTLSIFLSLALRNAKKKILVVDLDHNNNLTDFFLRDEEVETIQGKSIGRVLKGNLSIDDSIFKSSLGVDVIASVPELSQIAFELLFDTAAPLRFDSMLRDLKYDFVLIDTPPAISFELSCGLHVADTVLCPVGYSRWNIQGYSILESKVERAGGNKIFIGVPSAVTDKRVETLRDGGLSLTKTVIHKSEVIATASDAGKPLKEGSPSADEFKILAKEIAKI
ncbi:ParA family protein [Leptospira bourretii]|uniref:ParA family protein n=1 Tax=Leptospira bourretii TaxID=2484962 RepID=A0A4R9IGV7_9LEPT|nr:ParA family protein [Leptospira bourretii]TGK87208.1 ParA family protein [Leptospira bourretii]TGK87658.1 ParA family protein [Leptospira bourretii]TGL43928.1 ParA family protein [Leptospira bourretii]